MSSFFANFYKFWLSFVLEQQLDLVMLGKVCHGRTLEKRFLSFKFLGIGFSKAEGYWWELRGPCGTVYLGTCSSPSITQGQRVFSRLRQGGHGEPTEGESALTLSSVCISQRLRSWSGHDDIRLSAEVICNLSLGKSPEKEQNPSFLCRPAGLASHRSRSSYTSHRPRSNWMISRWQKTADRVSWSRSKMCHDCGPSSMQEGSMGPSGLFFLNYF